MRMARTASNRLMDPPLSPSLGLQVDDHGSSRDGELRRHSRYPASRAVRFSTEFTDPAAGRPTGHDAVAADGEVAHAPVASATMEAAYGHANYRVTAWQPRGKPAFVFLIAVGERRLLQPNVAEGRDFDEVMRNAAHFVEQLLDQEEA